MTQQKGRSALSDWTTQRWVCLTGKRLRVRDNLWLAGPIGNPDRIGSDFFAKLAAQSGARAADLNQPAGLFDSLAILDSANFNSGSLHPNVRAFYERTAAYSLDSWANWQPLFWPFGKLLSLIFSRRLQQLNVPLSGLDTSRGMTNEVLKIRPTDPHLQPYAAWVRKLVLSDSVLYAGAYSTARVPRFDGVCAKVVFPLPNGNAIVLMKPSVGAYGSLTLISAGDSFGDCGFYFTVHHADGTIHARHVKTMRESIRVYPDGNGIRADHILTIWRQTFLRIHYAARPTTSAPAPPSTQDSH